MNGERIQNVITIPDLVVFVVIWSLIHYLSGFGPFASFLTTLFVYTSIATASYQHRRITKLEQQVASLMADKNKRQ